MLVLPAPIMPTSTMDLLPQPRQHALDLAALGDRLACLHDRILRRPCCAGSLPHVKRSAAACYWRGRTR